VDEKGVQEEITNYLQSFAFVRHAATAEGLHKLQRRLVPPPLALGVSFFLAETSSVRKGTTKLLT
jgi:hypothetical protein